LNDLSEEIEFHWEDNCFYFEKLGKINASGKEKEFMALL